MKRGYFVTGFPGFISEQLIRLWMTEGETKRIYVLVLPSMVTKANELVEHMMQDCTNETTIHIIEGDITKEHLGLPDPIRVHLKDKLHFVWHLAAIYDLAVPKSIAFKVNVKGTYHLNEWVKSLKNVQRYVYFSTAYVAGKREGQIKADELLRPVAFHNHYEETKYEAEVLVNELKKIVPVTIIRPAIVKGSASSGATNKFDGSYYLMNMIERLKNLPIIPYIGRSASKLNVVPVDYVVRASNWLSHIDAGVGKTYHVTDPNPYPAREIFRFVLIALTGKKPAGKISRSVVDKILTIRVTRQFLKVEREALDYLFWMGNFDQSETEQDLLGSNIVCPDFLEGLHPMIAFYEENKNNKQYHSQID
ncbi:SDR family oxidoreductase [Jeotgalibacillus marinus]|uniref:SDR family oxidoreductase n=1 Tax=Jeotgalibacillus marinus TaxID=86667 RepID=A0ABV3Q721_9BACL